jgi:flagellar protein FlaG
MSISPVGGATAVALAPAQTPPRPLNQDQQAVIHAVKAVNAAALFGQDNEVTFVLDRASHHPVVRIVDKSTREVVAQIPSQAVLQLAAGIQDSNR